MVTFISTGLWCSGNTRDFGSLIRGSNPRGPTNSYNQSMTKNTGYRQVLRDRCPKVVGFALKWCKAKEKWLDHCYKNWVWIYSSKKERYKATKLVIGEKYKFNFHDTIDWNSLTPEELYEWKHIEEWVRFFQLKYDLIQRSYLDSKEAGKSIQFCKYEIMKGYLLDLCPRTTDSEETKNNKTKYVNQLTDFLIDCIEGRIR